MRAEVVMGAAQAAERVEVGTVAVRVAVVRVVMKPEVEREAAAMVAEAVAMVAASEAMGWVAVGTAAVIAVWRRGRWRGRRRRRWHR